MGGLPYDDRTPPKIEDPKMAKLRLLQQLQVQIQTLNRLKSLQEQRRLARSRVSYLPKNRAFKEQHVRHFLHVRYTWRYMYYISSIVYIIVCMRDIFSIMQRHCMCLKASCMQHMVDTL